MPVLHMETDATRAVGQQLEHTAGTLRQQSQQLAYVLQNLSGDWQGPSAAIFVAEMQHLLQQLNQFADNGQTLNQRLQQEVDEWERVTHGQGTVINDNVGNLPGSGGVVLGVTDSVGEIGNEVTLMEWFEGIYETIESLASSIAPHARVTEWLSGFGTALKGIDLVTSSNEVAAAREAWSNATEHYGTDAPETLTLRYEYSDAELSQVIPSPLKLILKQFKIWDDLIHSFEGAKYEGTHDLFNPPTVQ